MPKRILLSLIAGLMVFTTTATLIYTNKSGDVAQTSVGQLSKKSNTMDATYRCWISNVEGIAGKCTSPAFVLKKNGTYTMSSEKGTYTAKGDKIYFSESKLRGAGTFQENKQQIVFNYKYNGRQQIVTYLTLDNVGNSRSIPVKLTLLFEESDTRGQWISSVTLYDGENYYDAIAQSDGQQTVIADFRSVPSGKKYLIFLGAEENFAGEIDLKGAKGSYKKTINVPAPKMEIQAEQEAEKSEAQAGTKSKSTEKTKKKSSGKNQSMKTEKLTTDKSETSKTEKQNTKTQQETGTKTQTTITPAKCDPLVPSYTQKGCVE